MDASIRCPACGHTLEVSAEQQFVFCPYCGTDISQEAKEALDRANGRTVEIPKRQCHYCGYVQDAGNRICPICGRPAEPENRRSSAREQEYSYTAQPEKKKHSVWFWILVVLAVIFVVRMIGAVSQTDGPDRTVRTQATKGVYEVRIHVTFTANLLFSRYDVTANIDGQPIGTMKHGEGQDYTVRLEEGEHTIVFVNADNSSVKGSAKFTVAGDTAVAYRISCYAGEVSVTAEVAEESSSEALATESVTQATTGQ